MQKKQYNLGFSYEVTLNVFVDRDANFLELVEDNCDVIEDLILNALHDIDDIQILKSEVYKNG
jgi:hypothetical protein